jgi:hypothetical protein
MIPLKIIEKNSKNANVPISASLTEVGRGVGDEK